MPLFEVQVEVKSTDYYEVRAKSPEEASEKWRVATLGGTTIEEETVVSVMPVFFDPEDDDYQPVYDDDREVHFNEDDYDFRGA